MDWSRIRRLFSDLLDDCARVATSLQLDLDDVEMDRFFLIRIDQSPTRRIAARLSFRLGNVADIARSLGVSDASNIELEGLGVEVFQVNDHRRIFG